jgi:predicted ATP-dependent serine protease
MFLSKKSVNFFGTCSNCSKWERGKEAAVEEREMSNKPNKFGGSIGKAALWAMIALLLVIVLAVVGTYLSIFFVGYNR